MDKVPFAWDMPITGGNWRVVDANGVGVHMANYYEMHLIEEVERLKSKLEEALERDRKGDAILVELTLERDGLASRLDALQVATQNYLDAGPDPSDEIRWALHHALNDPVVEKGVTIRAATDAERMVACPICSGLILCDAEGWGRHECLGTKV